MNFVKKKWLQILIWVFLIGAVTWAGKGIFKYSVFSTHDGDHHIARAFDVIQTIKEGHFPLRWAGSLNYFCGIPIYNFFYPLIYYLIALINLFTKNIIFTLKIIDFGSLLLGTVFFYAWIKTETKKELAAIGGALTYLYAPYRFSLIFVRGSPEFLAYAILPIVLWLYALVFSSSGKKFVVYTFLASLTGAILTISHNFTVMFLMPIILAFLVLQFYTHKTDFKKIIWILFSFLGSFGMGSFFIGPALLEKKFTNIGQNFLEWRDHFPTFWQLIKSDWGYFYSSSGTINDGMSFMLGYAQWLILGIGTVFIIYQILRRKFKILNVLKENIYIIFFFLLSLLTVYLILPISIPLWEKIRSLQEIQFSWRLLGVAVFTISALLSFLLAKVKSKYIYIGIFIGVSLLTVVGTRNFMLPQPISDKDLYRYDNFEKFHPHRYSTTTMGDDVIAFGAKEACWFSTPAISTNNKETISFEVVEKGNTFASIKFLIDKEKIKGDRIVLGLGYFPEIHKIYLNGEDLLKYSDCGGKACFDIGKTKNGENFISWKVGQSKIENIFNYLTLAFFTIWLILLFINLTGKYKNRNNLLYFLVTVVIFFLFVFFRSYNLPDRIGFGWDQERDAVAVTNILSGKLTLLGPRVQGPNGFFLPPYFFYMLTPFYALAGGSPFAMTGFITVWSLVFFVISFLVLSKVFDKKLALIFLALWAVNPLAVSIDTIAWNPVVIPLLFIVLIYSIHLCFKNPKTKYFIFAGLMFGLGASFHLQFLFTFPMFIPLVIDIVKNRGFKNLISLLVSTVIPFLPIFIFDLRHGFLNFNKISEFVNDGGVGINRVIPVWENVSSYMVGGSRSMLLGLIIYVAVSVGLFVIGIKLKEKFQGKLIISLGLTWMVSIPCFYIFMKNPSEYYFNYLLIPFTVFLGLLLRSRKRICILVLTATIVYFLYQAVPLLGGVSLGLKRKDNSVVFLKNITANSSPFNVSFDVPFNEDTGYRYLLKYHNVPVSGNPIDPLIEFVIPKEKRTNTFTLGQIGIIIPKGWLENNWPEKSE